MKIEIKCRFSGAVLFSHEAENNTTRITLEAGVSSGAYLVGANLYGANLDGAYLDGANLTGEEKLIGRRPILQIGPIGSRCAYFVAYLTDKGIRLRAGCFFGTRAEFEAKLQESHGDSIHAKEYRAALDLIDAHAEIWTPATESENPNA